MGGGGGAHLSAENSVFLGHVGKELPFLALLLLLCGAVRSLQCLLSAFLPFAFLSLLCFTQSNGAVDPGLHAVGGEIPGPRPPWPCSSYCPPSPFTSLLRRRLPSDGPRCGGLLVGGEASVWLCFPWNSQTLCSLSLSSLSLASQSMELSESVADILWLQALTSTDHHWPDSRQETSVTGWCNNRKAVKSSRQHRREDEKL